MGTEKSENQGRHLEKNEKNLVTEKLIYMCKVEKGSV